MPAIPFQVNGFLGLGVESTYGTPVAPTTWLRFMESSIKAKHGTEYPQTSRDIAPEDALLGDYDPRLQFRAEARPENLGAVLKAWAGSGSSTSAQQGATAAYKHTIKPTLVSNPITVEERRGTLNKSTILDGTVLQEVRLEYAKSFLAVAGQALGRRDNVDQAPSVPTWESKRTFLKHQSVVSLGSAVYGVKSSRVVMRRKVIEDDYEVGDRFRKGIDIGPAEVTFEIEAGLRDLTLEKRSMGGSGTATTPQPDPIYNNDTIVWTSEELAAAGFPYKLEVDLPRSHWERTEIESKAGEPIYQKLTNRALWNGSKVVQIDLTNTKTTI